MLLISQILHHSRCPVLRLSTFSHAAFSCVNKMKEKKYHTFATLPNCKRKIVRKETKSIPLKHKYMTARSLQ